jgi:hypothetical protein
MAPTDIVLRIGGSGGGGPFVSVDSILPVEINSFSSDIVFLSFSDGSLIDYAG